MVENQRNLLVFRFPYLDNNIFQPPKIKLVFESHIIIKIRYREQRELMEELNRPPEFNLSIFDAANLKLFESESKNEIFYEIIPFIIQSRKSWKHDSDFREIKWSASSQSPFRPHGAV